MQIAVSHESVRALREFSQMMLESIEDLRDDSLEFQSEFQKLLSGCEPMEERLSGLCSICVHAIEEASDAIEELRPGLNKTAELLSAYLSRKLDLETEVISKKDWPVQCIPDKTGHFVGKKGESLFIPDDNEARSILAKYGLKGVVYINGDPDFRPLASIDTPWGHVNTLVEIAHMTPNRQNGGWEFGRRSADDSYDPSCDLGNFNQADLLLAEKIVLCRPALLPSLDSVNYRHARANLCRQIAAFRRASQLTWHEYSDARTMQLVPWQLHKACPHTGGVSIARALQRYADIDEGGI